MKDRIPPLTSPAYVNASEVAWLQDDDLVLGYVEAGDARAHPIRILNFHEIVNETIGGRPVLVSYCPLCRSGLVFDRRIGDRLLTFGNTGGLYESDLVMYDHQTDSFWFQVGGEAIVGTLTGSRLSLLPSFLGSWETWKSLHPNSAVLSKDTGFRRPYHADPFLGYDELGTPPGFPVANRDVRLDPKEKILGLEQGGVRRAYSLTRLGNSVVMDRVGGQQIVVISLDNGRSGVAYRPTVEERTLTFVLKDGGIEDVQSGSTWNIAGVAIDGPLGGRRLMPIPVRSTFWFAWVAAFPDTTIYHH